jgi:Rieske Fe-S protein
MNDKCADRMRRRICQAGLALGAAVVLPACGGSSAKSASLVGGSCSDENTIAVGSTSDVALNDAVLHNLPTTDIYVCHDADGFYAVDAGCTHFGCDVNMKASGDLKQGFVCPCHGATYDAQGENPTTPAPAPLPHYSLCLQESGTLVVDLDTSVDASYRLKG